MARRTVEIDLNRVEGDLEIQVDLEDDVIVDARCIGTLYRGFEQILIGRAPRDALVITPRVCGICGTAHLYATVRALERIGGIRPPRHATHIRDLCLMAENLQSDLRQTFLFFTPDFCHPSYAGHPLADDAARSFAPFQGDVARGCLETSRKVLRIVAIFGGQWPHSSYMVPGGVTLPANAGRLLDARYLVAETRAWLERSVLGDNLDTWLALDSGPAFFEWLESSAAHRDAGLGLLCRFSRSIGLQSLGRGTPHLISFGMRPDPVDGGGFPAGFYDGDADRVEPLDQMRINEHVSHSWFMPYPGGRHPWSGETIPDHMSGQGRYTWAKAPRYGDKVAQTGPLAELRIGAEPLITDLLAAEGDNTWLRQFARLRRAAWTVRAMAEELDALQRCMDEPHFVDPGIQDWPDGEGCGLVEAARGALGHWLRIGNGVIQGYQIVTPTAWNASPRDSAGQPGHWERSLIGLRLEDPEDPVQIGHVIRSHDPCLVCTVHFIGRSRKTYPCV
ncbi:nickel-dependent hydrogenase large subunit [Imhoffiella purpurea]|uniref:Uptake hydrogenase large subunit n=1 Tax=Imhoffiella purpurea TaxID=1249627 RepID=W9V249_9GAMM|nr:nickel-dependent hydrogenase large subunit [Imhoffiella purpurea]EXJ13379.1 Uptake hydrogenase large subunit [Imhoffiella purpurea]